MKVVLAESRQHWCSCDNVAFTCAGTITCISTMHNLAFGTNLCKSYSVWGWYGFSNTCYRNGSPLELCDRINVSKVSSDHVYCYTVVLYTLGSRTHSVSKYIIHQCWKGPMHRRCPKVYLINKYINASTCIPVAIQNSHGIWIPNHWSDTINVYPVTHCEYLKNQQSLLQIQPLWSVMLWWVTIEETSIGRKSQNFHFCPGYSYT